MTADPDGAFRDQALFAGFFSADVMNYFVLKDEKDVGNDLLIGWIVLSLWTRKKEIISTRKECVEVLLRLKVEALETAKLIEQAAPNHQDVLVGRTHH